MLSFIPSLISIQVENFIQSICRLNVKFGDDLSALSDPFFDLVKNALSVRLAFLNITNGNHSLQVFFQNDFLGSIHVMLLNEIRISSTTDILISAGSRISIPLSFSGLHHSWSFFDLCLTIGSSMSTLD
jgi:hypothetical protein